MKWIFGTLVFTSVLALSSCGNAASKVDDSASVETTASTPVNNANTNNAMAANAVTSEGTATFQFETTSHSFGNITEGDVAEHTFTFTNVGEAPLIISSAQGSCGCTVPEWPRTPIAPGESGNIKVSFNSAGKPGNQSKTVTISANTIPQTTVLNISATVAAKQQQ